MFKNTREKLEKKLRKEWEASELSGLRNERDCLEKEVRALKREVEDLKLKRKIEDEDIKHMVRMKEERLDLEHQKKEAELERQKHEAIAEVKDKYRDKTENQLEKRAEDLKGMYAEILKRLPDVNVRLKGDV